MRWLPGVWLASALLWAGTGKAAPFAFVSDGARGSISVVDLGTHSLLGRLHLGGATTGLRAEAAGQRIYAVDTIGSRVSVVDISSGVVTSVGVGRRPAGIAVTPDGQRVFVANWDDGTASVLDGDTNAVIRTVAVGVNPGDVATNGHLVLVANFGSGDLAVLDAEQGGLIQRVAVGRFPAGVAMGPGGERAFVSNFQDDTVSVVDIFAGEVVATLAVGRAPRSVVRDPSRPLLYVGNSGDGSISVVDTGSGALIRTIQLGTELLFDLRLSPSGDRLYAVSVGSARLIGVDPLNGVLTDFIPLGATGHIALGAILSSAPPVTPVVSAPRTTAWWGLLFVGAGVAIRTARIRPRRA